MRQSDHTKESGGLFAQAFLAVEGVPDVEYGHDGVMALAHAYLDLEVERDVFREALERIEDNAEAWHGNNEAKARALTVIATWCREALERHP